MQHYQRIRDLREDHDLTQEELCRRLYMHKTTYTNYEQGKHTVPLDFAVVLAEFYHVSLDYIAGLTNFQQGIGRPQLSADELALLESFRQLSERHKGRVEQLISELSEQERSR
ncbi:MAG: helix-turn-helix domain-containing protein [Oscillospiraceae bacterium]|nr:helix-turn-helix domain-containing protein [Oscillospiraceae bacterium]